MKRGETTNTFQDGLVMDFNPLVTPNTMLTNALNATLLTYNGNDNSLQNDMGNGRVETAYLPEGFIPLGTCSFGGIVYIASYNPFTKQSQIGSFPSPERNITTDELKESDKFIQKVNFYESGTNNVINPRYKILLLEDRELNQGDKFQIFSDNLNAIKDRLSALNSLHNDINDLPRYLKLHVISINSKGEISYLDSDLTWYNENENNYFIRLKKIELGGENEVDLDEYRSLVQANYSVYTAPFKGKIGILAELECISSFEVGYDAKVKDGKSELEKTATFTLDLNWTYDNDNKYSKNQINPIGYKINIIDNVKNSKKESIHPINLFNKTINDINIYLNDNYIFPPGEETKQWDYEDWYNYFDNLNLIRKNDGSDETIKSESFDIDYILTKDTNGNINDYKIQIEVTPIMEFGYLDYLKQTLDINLAYLNQGIYNLTEWRYYVNKEDIVINWGLEAYPNEGDKVTSVDFTFIEFYNILNKDENYNIWSVFNGDNHYENVSIFNKSPQLKSDNKSSYSGRFQNTIKYDEELLEKFKLEKNKCYFVEITINIDSTNNVEPKHYYRILYTIPIFNKYYFNNDDFANCRLDKDLFYYEKIFETPAPVVKDAETRYYYDDENGESKKFNIKQNFIIKETDDEDTIIFKNTRQEDYVKFYNNCSYQLLMKNFDGFDTSKVFSNFCFDYQSDNIHYRSDMLNISTNAQQISRNPTNLKLNEISVDVKDPKSEINTIKNYNLDYSIMPLAVHQQVEENNMLGVIDPDLGGERLEGQAGGGSGGLYGGSFTGNQFKNDDLDEYPNPFDLNGCDLQLIVGSPDKNSDQYDKINNSPQLISLRLNDADFIIRTPFQPIYLEKLINCNYQLEKLTDGGTKRLKFKSYKRSDLWLNYDSNDFVHVPENSFASIDATGQEMITNFIKPAFKDFNLGFCTFYNYYTNATNVGYKVYFDSNTSDDKDRANFGRDLGKSSSDMLIGMVINSSNPIIICSKSGADESSDYKNIKNVLSNLYIWKERNISKEIYALDNLIWWNNYTIQILLDIPNINVEVSSFCINNTLGDQAGTYKNITNSENLPNNLKINDIPNLEGLNLSLKYNINSDNLKKLLAEYNVYFYNEITNKITQNESVSTLINNENKIVETLNVSNNHQYRISRGSDDSLKVESIKSSPNNLGTFYFIGETDELKDNNFRDGSTGQAQVLAVYNLVFA